MRGRILSIIVACLCLALASVPGWTEDTPARDNPSQNTSELNEIVVTATRADSTVLESPSSISVISAQQIADSGAVDVAHVINGQPGVDVKDYGPAGAAQSVSLRGSTSSQVLVLLDGIRINSTRDGGVDLSTIPKEIIDHIEIVRGGESALYGSGAVGGVVNIVTKKAEKPSISVSITNGGYIPHAATSVDQDLSTFAYIHTPVAAKPADLLDTQNVEASFQGMIGGMGFSAGGSFTRAANGYTWLDSDDIKGWRRRTDADSTSGSAFAGIDAPLLDGKLSMKSVLDASDAGVPGSLTTIALGARQSDTSISESVAWKADRFLTDGLTMDLKAFYRYDQLRYNDPDPVSPVADLHRTHTVNLDLTQKLTVSDLVSAVYGASTSYDRVQSTKYSTDHSRLNLAGFLSVPLAMSDDLTFTPAARYDYYSDFPGRLSYSISAVLRVADDSSVRASFGSAYRAPSMDELYWFDAFGDVGNPDLKPETSFSGEIGWSLQRKQFSIDAAVFARMLYDGISDIWPQDPVTMNYSPVNISQSLLPGVELHGTVSLTETLSLEASYTYIYSLLLKFAGVSYDAKDSLRTPFVPIHSLSTGVKYGGKVISVSVGVQYVGKRYTEFSNDESRALPGYFLGNADCRLNASDNVTITLALKNVFNTLYYTQSGYPMPPFSMETGVRLH